MRRPHIAVAAGFSAVEVAVTARHRHRHRHRHRRRHHQLGQGHTITIGDNESPSSIGPIELGDDVVDIAVSDTVVCALLAGGGVRCWGQGGGVLGQANSETIGDNELPISVPLVSLGNTPVVDVVLGRFHACALYDDATIRCWGGSTFGVLGQGYMAIIGDDELPSSVDTVDVGGDVDAVWAGGGNTCVKTPATAGNVPYY